jgi:hypothetical protein
MARHRFEGIRLEELKRLEGLKLWVSASLLSVLGLALLGYVVVGTVLPEDESRVAARSPGLLRPPTPPEPEPSPSRPAPSRSPSALPRPAGTTLFVSDLPFARAENGLGPVERDRGNGGRTAGDGATLTIKGMRYGRGLGVHADSNVQVVLGGRCDRFSATIGVDDRTPVTASGQGTRVVFLVLGDGAVLYRSPVLRRGDPARRVTVGLGTAQRLDLIVDDLGFPFGDRADWADARLSCDRAPAAG